MENWIFSELYKSMPLTSVIHFWRSKAGAEVDFVVEQAGKIMALEVKSADLDHPGLAAQRAASSMPTGREIRRSESFPGTTVSMDNCQVDFLTPYQLATALR
jgi:predicted AAA+ superfamily ATPase